MSIDARIVRTILGPLDDAVVARIARTGATEEHLREAVWRVTSSEETPSLESRGSPIVRELVFLLERIAADEADNESNASA